MITVNGLQALHARYAAESAEGWILLQDRASLNGADALLAATFLIADDEAEEDKLLDQYPQFLEIPTFQAVVENEADAGRTTARDIAEASLYYLEKDTFRD